jgi:hypothetical protein
MPVLVEQFVVVGDKSEAAGSAELWRFLPKAFKVYYNIKDPAEIQRRVETGAAARKDLCRVADGTNLAAHVAALQTLFDSGATIVNVHWGQADQRKLIEFYGRHVLPKLPKFAKAPPHAAE